MKLKRLRNLLVIAGTAGVSPASSNAFTRRTVESGNSSNVAFHESGRDARSPSRGRASTVGLLLFVGTVVACLILFPLEVLARVGGGGSYSGGGGSGGGGGGGGGAIIAVVRMLVWLTVE